MASERAREVIEAWNRADSDRGTWKNHWQAITELCLPERNDYTVMRTPGMLRNQKIFDATPEFALNQFANGMHSLLTSPYLPWMMLRLDNDRLDRVQEVRAWMQAVTDDLYSQFNSPRLNFASQSHEAYLDLGSIGTACMSVLEDSGGDVLFSTRHMKECVFWENDKDRVDMLCRRWHFTPKQAVETFGAAAGEKVLKLYNDGQQSDKKCYYLHMVRPRKVRTEGRYDAKNKAFESCYVSEEDMEIILEGGFDEFPYLAPRLSKTAGEIYGRGPGMTMLPDMKMLQEMMKTHLKAAQKVVDPPLQIPDDGYLLPIKTVPGSQNFYRANSPANARIMPIETKGRIDISTEMLMALRAQINRGFYVEWMRMPSNPEDPAGAGKGITATWVLQQRDDNMRFMSPILSRLQSEFCNPAVERVFAIRWRQSVRTKFGPGSPFPPPPALLANGPRWHVEYLSPLAIAQRSSQLDSVGRLIQQQAFLKNLNPNAIDIIDHEFVMRTTADDLNAPAGVLKSPGQLKSEKDAHAQAQASQVGTDALKNVATAAKDGTQAIANVQGNA